MIMKVFSDSDDDDGDVKISLKHCLLRVQVAELRRPVSYFWSAHDFVVGLRDALKGHAFLVENGILHCGVSENNIVLGRHPNDMRGQITDFDTMAIPYPTTETRTTPCESLGHLSHSVDDKITSTQASTYNAYRTSSPPYMSLNVISGNKHTEYDDVESFFYVLILFFLSSKGPMEKYRILQAERHGFTFGPGSQLPAHPCIWPPPYKSWIRHSDLDTAISSKTAAFDLFVYCASSQIVGNSLQANVDQVGRGLYM
ncbi:hypothetical protein OG21DRAFT_263530 [Imleria badia]|nr:hypothetical protein OG21DRAFT_263530 [Imleria badia]